LKNAASKINLPNGITTFQHQNKGQVWFGFLESSGKYCKSKREKENFGLVFVLYTQPCNYCGTIQLKHYKIQEIIN
jgi:hypothetical protein